MEIASLIKLRYSPRAFSEKSVSQNELNTLFEAARWAPSSRNEQPWRFVFVVKTEKTRYESLFSVLSEWNQKWVSSAPVLIAAIAKTTFEHKHLPNAHAQYDLGQSVAYFSLQATELGLHLHQMGGFDPQKAKQVLNLPDGFEVITMIALGYKGSLDRIPEEYHQQENRVRERIPLEQFVFKSKWT